MEEAALAQPIRESKRALAQKIAKSNPRQWRDVQIRQMRQHEAGHYELPMRIPAANTNAPPTTTWKAAARNGVSMYR